jgi:hypothetical protein
VKITIGFFDVILIVIYLNRSDNKFATFATTQNSSIPIHVVYNYFTGHSLVHAAKTVLDSRFVCNLLLNGSVLF